VCARQRELDARELHHPLIYPPAVAPPAPVACGLRARYSFWGGASELDKTFPLLADERINAEGRIRVRTGIMFRRPGELRLTNLRLLIVSHYAFQPDRAFEFPRGSLISIQRPDGAALRIVYRTQAGEQIMTIEDHLMLDDALEVWGADAPADA
jgi:hypothetical protein